VLLRSFLDYDKLTCRARLCERREARIRFSAKPKRIVIFMDGKVMRGHDTQHRTRSARLWRCRCRLVMARQRR
jgi:hypothetical protein